MPTYQYACTACDDRLEVVQKFADDPLTECESCGGRLRKVFSPVGVVFKGSGFYRTDSRNAAANGSSGASQDKQDKQAGSEGTSAEKSADSGSSSGASADSSSGSESGSNGSAASSESGAKKATEKAA